MFASDDVCSICLEYSNNVVFCHDSIHSVHPKCMLKWCQQNKFTNILCPICKKQLTSDQLNTIGSTNTISPNSVNCYEIMKKQLAEGKDIHVWNSEGKTILHRMGGCTDKRCTELLLNSDININSQDNNGDTPFHISIKGLQFSFALKLASNTNILDLRNNKGIIISILAFNYYYDFYLSKDDWRLEQMRLIIKEFAKKNFYNPSQLKILIKNGVI